MPVADTRLFPLPGRAVVPDYGAGGLFGLVADIGRFLDGSSWRGTGQAEVEGVREPREPRILVFLLIDGLGDAFLDRFGRGSLLHAHRQRRITSVFPSTTASALTTILTGLAPAAHGLTGWFINDRRFGGAIAPLPLQRRGGGALRGWFALQRLFPYGTLFQRRKRPSVLASPVQIAGSPFSRRHARGATTIAYAGLEGLVEAIVASVDRLVGPAGGYIHAYYPDFDSLSHDHGANSPASVAEFARIDAAFAVLLDRLVGRPVDIVVSADHGFIDAPDEQALCLNDLPELAGMLAAPLSGERRAAFCAVRSGAEAEFECAAREVFAGRVAVARSADLLAGGLFGPGRPHPRIHERIGSHALLMEAGWTIRDLLPGEDDHFMRGVHGGLSPQEMWIPVIEARCG